MRRRRVWVTTENGIRMEVRRVGDAQALYIGPNPIQHYRADIQNRARAALQEAEYGDGNE